MDLLSLSHTPHTPYSTYTHMAITSYEVTQVWTSGNIIPLQNKTILKIAFTLKRSILDA